MYFCDKGIVLRHKDVKEFDRIVSIFSEKHGRMEVIFKGVRKPQAKLMCFSEVMCHSDFRFYLSKYTTMPLCTGASLINSYNSIREDLDKITNFFFISDIFVLMTPINQSSFEKYKLLISALDYISKSNKISKWFKTVFMLNFLECFGVGFKKTQVGYDSRMWEIIHSGFERIDELCEYDYVYQDISGFAIEQMNKHSPREIKTEFYDRLCDWRSYELSRYNK
ncbi:MAG: DNA repair protein RecO [Elusimicrobiales bacterium]